VGGLVRIEAADRGGSERLLRYCARPLFTPDRLRELDGEHLLYERTKPGPRGNRPLRVTPLELRDCLAAPVAPPRIHRHRYFGASMWTAAHQKLRGDRERRVLGRLLTAWPPSARHPFLVCAGCPKGPSVAIPGAQCRMDSTSAWSRRALLMLSPPRAATR
jgi:hypothetical protein